MLRLTALRQGCGNDLCSLPWSGTFGSASAKSPLITWGNLPVLLIFGSSLAFAESLSVPLTPSKSGEAPLNIHDDERFVPARVPPLSCRQLHFLGSPDDELFVNNQ